MTRDELCAQSHPVDFAAGVCSWMMVSLMFSSLPPVPILPAPCSSAEQLGRSFPGVFVAGVLQNSNSVLRDTLESLLQRSTSIALADSVGVTLRGSANTSYVPGGSGGVVASAIGAGYTRQISQGCVRLCVCRWGGKVCG